MSDWEIKKTSGSCFGSEKQFVEGEEYYAALVEGAECLERRDYCAEYWESAKPVVYCYWKTKLPGQEEKRRVFIDEDMLMAFFERLADERDQEKLNFRFVLMLILMRKRRLKYESSKKEGDKEFWRLRIVGENEFTEVVNPHLDDAQIEQLSSQLGEILNADLDD